MKGKKEIRAKIEKVKRKIKKITDELRIEESESVMNKLLKKWAYYEGQIVGLKWAMGE